MKSIPIKALIITYIILIGYLIIDFSKKKEEKFWQFNYQWDSIENLEDFGEVKIDSVRYNYIEITTQKAPEQVTGNTLLLNNNYYFNFENAYIKQNKIKFTGGFWVLNQPIKKEKASAKTVRLPVKQPGNLKVNIITDAHLLWRGGKNVRKWLFEENKNYVFVGNQTDVYGFPYTGEILNSVEKTLENKANIPAASVYVVMLGTHDITTHTPKVIEGFNTLKETLLRKSPKATIYVINLPPSLDNKREKYNQAINKQLPSITTDQVEIIDFYALIKNQKTGVKTQDGIHYNAEAYKQLVELLNKKIDGNK
ncbi:MAG: SGNH/GDSL hydrolase family protein [Mesonia hippocampi]|uniref:SGNH/GDSL hydrolase family protein n=1 Tax=Mesonia hippocampi TaxID=1628250 RepID=UPI003F9C4E4B